MSRRTDILDCIFRLDDREQDAIQKAVLHSGSGTLPRPHVRQELRAWFRKRRDYLHRELLKADGVWMEPEK